ncbi:MAG: hypothetical protein AAGM21_10265 [Pseudomonadota bacterium]
MTEARITLHPKMHHPKSIQLVETHWGYILSSQRATAGGSAMSEAAMRFFGIVLVMTAYAIWLVPAGLIPGEPLQLKAALAVVLALGGATLYFLSSRALVQETQVDTTAREIRLARRVRDKKTRVTRRIPFSSVQSAYVRRDEGKPAELHLRLGAQETVHLVSGLERELNLVHGRFCRDLKSPAERMEMRLSVAAPTPVRAVRLRQAGQR